MDVNLGENKETLQAIRQCYNDMLFATTQFHIRLALYYWNTYGPRYNEMRKLWKYGIKKSGKLTCFIADRIREKGGFTFGPSDLGKPSQVPEIDRMPEDKSHHLSEEDSLAVALIQVEALVRQAKKYAECADQHGAHADTRVFNFIAIKLEKGAQIIRGMLTPRDLKPPMTPPSPVKVV